MPLKKFKSALSLIFLNEELNSYELTGTFLEKPIYLCLYLSKIMMHFLNATSKILTKYKIFFSDPVYLFSIGIDIVIMINVNTSF